MKLHSPQFLSQSLFKFSHLPLRNAAFRPFSVKPDRIRVSKSLVDDEAELSNWVDDLRTGRAETVKPAQRVGSSRDRDGGFRPRKSSVSRSSNFAKRKPYLNSNSKKRFGLSSDDDDDKEVVERGKFKGDGGGGSGSIGEFLSEDDFEGESESDDNDDEEIVNKSRSVLFGKQNEVSTTPRPSSPGGSDSYLSDSRCVFS
jgi:ATP-dependent RNA helicase MSS116